MSFRRGMKKIRPEWKCKKCDTSLQSCGCDVCTFRKSYCSFCDNHPRKRYYRTRAMVKKNKTDITRIVCPSCQTNFNIQDMVRYIICHTCNFVMCPNCSEWISGGEDALNNHYYLDYCKLTE